MKATRFLSLAAFGLFPFNAYAQSAEALAASCGEVVHGRGRGLELALKRESITIADVSGAKFQKRLILLCAASEHEICRDASAVDGFSFAEIRFLRNDVSVPAKATFGVSRDIDLWTGKMTGFNPAPDKRYRIFISMGGLIEGEDYRLSAACELP